MTWTIRAALFLAIASISFAAICFRKAAPTHPLVMSAVRLSIASALLMPWLFKAYGKKQLSKKIVQAGLLAGLFYAIHFGAWVWSLTLTSVAASVTLVTATPIVLAVLGLLTKKDPPSKPLLGALLIASLGIAMIGGTDWSANTSALIGDALAFLGAVAMAGYLLNARRLGQDFPILGFSAIACACGALLLWLTILITNQPIALSTNSLIWLTMAALIPQLMGHTLLTWSLKHISPTQAGIATLGEPVGSTLLGMLILKEFVPWTTLVGCGFTLFAVLIAMMRSGAYASSSAETIN